MTPLLQAVHQWLDDQGVAHALIGAMAMGTYGYSRSSLDIDLMATAEYLLEPQAWNGFVAEAIVECRPGGSFDPLAGVIRISQPGEIPVDLVLFEPQGWQREVIHHAVGDDLKVARLADLILLKLFAGGPRDRADIHGMLDLFPTVESEVQVGVSQLPSRCQRLWSGLLRVRADSPAARPSGLKREPPSR